MSQGFNYYHAYNTGWSNEMRRSFAPYTGVQQTPYYAGYWQSGRALEYNMFWCLLHDTASISAWDTNIMFYNDFTYSEGGRDTMALCHEFKRGLWDLIRTGQWQHDGIAIQYSQDAINAAQLVAKEEEHKDVRDVWVKLIEDLGLQYNFVATQQIEGGLLTHPRNDFERYKVLILPEAMAITEKERVAIEAFVKAGGAVIGDFNIGLLDGLCRKRTAGMLDGLFGVRREGQASTGLDLEIKLPGAEAQGVKLPVAEGMVAAGATSYGLTAAEPRSQALFANPVGKGKAWYLNVDLRQYEDERTFHTPGEKQIRALLGDACRGDRLPALINLCVDELLEHEEVRATVAAAKGEIMKASELRAVDQVGRLPGLLVPGLLVNQQLLVVHPRVLHLALVAVDAVPVVVLLQRAEQG